MAEAASTTRPARNRAAGTTTARKSTPAKAAAKPAAKAAEAADATKTEVTRFKVELEATDPTKGYAKFVVPDSYKGTVAGTIYAPHGTARVVIFCIGEDDTEE